MGYVEQHPYISPLVFMGVYIIYASLALPGILLMTLLGGFIFPQPMDSFCTLLSQLQLEVRFFSCQQEELQKIF